jgi:hypothetical protein
MANRLKNLAEKGDKTQTIGRWWSIQPRITLLDVETSGEQCDAEGYGSQSAENLELGLSKEWENLR